MGYAVLAHAELLKAGHASLTNQMIYWSDEAVVAVDANALPLGIITFRRVKHDYECGICIGYVEEMHRRSGIYRQLWDALVTWMQEDVKTVRRIVGTTHLDNRAMRDVAKALGRVEASINLVYPLKP